MEEPGLEPHLIILSPFSLFYLLNPKMLARTSQCGLSSETKQLWIDLEGDKTDQHREEEAKGITEKIT